METTQTRSFVRTVLPWLIAAGVLLVYLFTLNTTITSRSIWPLARAAGFDWHQTYIAPLTYLVTLPIRWLPTGAQLFALNFLSALFAAASLGLLARSVALLPHDRTQLQREKRLDENAFLTGKLAWVPVVFAVVAAAFQLSFWENAVVGTGEMLDLLLFAYCVRCLLEYRVEDKNSWLYRLSVVYGAGMANNFAMLAFFPALIVSLVWIKGWRFFRFDFLVKMFLLGLAGLSLYLVLPLMNLGDTAFWASLKTNLTYQKQIVVGMRQVAIMPAIFCLVPLLLMGFKWPGGFGDQSPVGSLFANLAAILLHAGLLVFCLYIVFDPDTPVSPRHIADTYRTSGVRFVFLPAYFLGALIVGYYSGFLLVVFSGTPGRSRRRLVFPPIVNYAVTAAVCAGAAYVAGRLLYQNFPKIRALNSPSLREYAQELAKSLPEKPAVIFGDDPVQLHAVASVVGRKSDHVFIEATAMTELDYHRFLQRRYGNKLPKVEAFPGETGIGSLQNIRALDQMRATRELVYLHPSFGYFFEAFYLEPRQLTYVLKPYPTNALSAPAPDAALIAAQQTYWNTLRGGALKNLKDELKALPTDVKKRPDHTASFVGTYYSRALDWWGAELQRANRFEEAAPLFAEAVVLNPDNAAALVNAAANELWRRERKRLPKMTDEQQAKLALYRGNVTYLFTACGPVDEPSFLTELATTFTQNTLYRQAEQMLRRSLDYVPDDLSTILALVNVQILGQRPDAAIATLAETRRLPNWNTLDAGTRIEAARLEALAWLAKGDFKAAEDLLKSVVEKNRAEGASYYAFSHLYTTYANQLQDMGDAAGAAVQRTNALRVLDPLLQTQPTNAVARFTEGNLAFYTGNFERAVQAFTKVLELTGENRAALINRAVANLRWGLSLTNTAERLARLRAARTDYETYRTKFTPDYRVYYGLGQIAYEEKDWKTAREHYENYMSLSGSADPEERRKVRERIEELKGK